MFFRAFSFHSIRISASHSFQKHLILTFNYVNHGRFQKADNKREGITAQSG